MPFENTSFGTYIKLGRISKGITKSELARRVGITPQYVTDIETDRLVPSEDKIEKLVEVLDLEEKQTFRIADKVPTRIMERAKRDYFSGR